MRTRAIVIVEPFKIEVRDVEIPAPEPHEVVVRTLVGDQRRDGTPLHHRCLRRDGKRFAANFRSRRDTNALRVVEQVGERGGRSGRWRHGSDGPVSFCRSAAH